MRTGALWIALTLGVAGAVMGCSSGSSGSEPSRTDQSGSPAPAAEEAPDPAPAPAPAPEPAAAPDEVVRQYLQAGADGNEERVRALLDPACHENEAMTRVDAVRMMGIAMTVESMEVAVQSSTEDAATVSYTVHGSVHGDNAQGGTGGLKIRIGNINMEGASKGGQLSLRRIDGAWKVTCS